MSDYARHLVYETEGRRGADERGWNGEAARIAEIERQREEEYAYRAAEAANEEPDPRDCERHEPTFSDGEWMLVRVTTDGRLVGAKANSSC
jgi:hypothetical protein